MGAARDGRLFNRWIPWRSSAAPSPDVLQPLVRIEQVSKVVDRQQVLSGVSLQLARGRVLGLLGPNGAGKTSLLRMVLDLDRPDAGRVEVLRRRPNARLRSRIGYLPEERGLYPDQPVLDVLTFLVGLSGATDPRARAEAWLQRVGLAEQAQSLVRNLSKGMQQKVQLGAAVLHEPDLVILDEPFTGFDPMNRRLVGEVVAELTARGAGVIVSTHLLDQAQQLCDDVVLLRGGRVLLSGELRTVRQTFAGTQVELRAARGWHRAPGVRRLVRSVRAGLEHDEVDLHTDARPSELLELLTVAGVEVTHFSHRLPTLEEVFVRAVETDTAHSPAPAQTAARAAA